MTTPKYESQVICCRHKSSFLFTHLCPRPQDSHYMSSTHIIILFNKIFKTTLGVQTLQQLYDILQ